MPTGKQNIFGRPNNKPDRPGVMAERRREDRFRSNDPVVIALSGGSTPQREYLSMIFNRSRGGMGLETSEPFAPGAVLNIRPGMVPTERLHHGKRPDLPTSALIQVKWCSEFLDESDTHYRLGVKNFS